MNNTKEIIDFRSDTFTVPDRDMREYMASAEVGDDVFAEDPSVNRLQEKVAKFFGKEAALFVPSGTMGNQLGLRVHTNDGDEIIAEADAHIFYYETAGPSVISRLQVRTILSENGEIPIDDLEKSLRTSEYYFPESKLLCLESSHNRHGGYPLSLEYVSNATDWAKGNGLATHLDGARLWNTLVALDADPIEYCKGFDTISVCFSKGLGAPIGSALVGSAEQIRKALKWRKILGGGMRQAGIIAAGAEYAFENNYSKLNNDHTNTKKIAQAMDKSDKIKVNLESVLTNILKFETLGFPADALISRCKEEGVLFMATGPDSCRIVLHHQITDEMVESAIATINRVLKDL